MTLERLQKLLARAGAGSRRACEELITAGRVTVDGRPVTELGAKADLATQDVRLDGQRIRAEAPEYWILNKPKGVVCTNDDPAGRLRPIDLVRGTGARLFAVGRLDADSKGLLLMTNDGEFANRLTHPRYSVPKTYVATVGGEVTGEDVRRLIRGVRLAEGRTRAAVIQVLKRGPNKSILRIIIREGRNRQIRRMLARLRHPVRDLVRTRIGQVSLRDLDVGKSRRLTPDEVEYLRKLPDTPPPAPAPRPEKVAREAPAAGPPTRPRPKGRRPFRPDRPGRGEPQGPATEAEPPHPFDRNRQERRPPVGPPREGRPQGGPPRGRKLGGGPSRGGRPAGGPGRGRRSEGGPSRGRKSEGGPGRERRFEGGPPRGERPERGPGRGRRSEGGPPRGRKFEGGPGGERRFEGGPPRGGRPERGPGRGRRPEGGPPRGRKFESGPARGRKPGGGPPRPGRGDGRGRGRGRPQKGDRGRPGRPGGRDRPRRG